MVDFASSYCTEKIIWAVSPFEGSGKRHAKTLETLEKAFEATQPVIQPVTLVPAGLFRPSKGRDTWSEIASAVYQELDQKIKGGKVPGLQPGRLLRVVGDSKEDMVRALIQFGIDEEADLIAVDSHSRKGLERIFLGSFAETLVLQSPLPVMVTNPRLQPLGKLKRILFPTDFSETSHEVFLRVAKMAADLNVPIYLFHKIYFASPEIGMPFVFPAVAKESVTAMKREFYELGQQWADHAKGYGTRVKIHLDTHAGPALDEILRVLKTMRDTTLVAMASQSGQLKSLLLGSLTRQILRHSPCPVLVLHAEQEGRIQHFLDGAEKLAYTYTANPLIR